MALTLRPSRTEMRKPIVLYQPPKRVRTEYRIGLSAWTDRSMLAESEFYPRKTMSAEERLWWYSRFFDVVEVNSSFYAIPSIDTTTGWAARTPPGFLFNVKALGILTGHDTESARLPDELRRLLPRALQLEEPDGAGGTGHGQGVVENLARFASTGHEAGAHHLDALAATARLDLEPRARKR